MEVREILERLDKPRFFLGEGLQVKRQNTSEWVCKCPFCDDTLKDPHFNLNIIGGTWICFKCGAHGNALGFYMQLHNVSMGQAVKAIREFAGIPDDPPAAPPKKHSQGQEQGKGAQGKTSKRRRALVPVTAGPEPGKAAGEVAAASDSDDDSGTVPPGDTDTAANVYQLLIDKLTLSDADREALKTKRGFTDATIDEFQFRSGGGPEVVAAINEVAAAAGTPAMVKAGILVEVNGTLAVNDQLLDNRILIPYLDEAGRVYHLRPHKLGFKAVPNQAYCRKLLAKKPEHIVLTEGEFKAVALYQWGFPALAVPGVSSFAAKNYERLKDLLREFGVKAVTVVFDNEDKSNPAYSNFKEKVEDRYDTQFWAYIMAWKLSRDGFRARVGWLPDTWRTEGKADFDGALAQKHTAREIQTIIDAAVLPAEFLEALPDEAQRIVRRKIARHFTTFLVRREFNKYIAIRSRGTESFEEPISNFVINIKSSFFTSEGVIRNVEFANEYGEVSGTFPMQPGDMAGLNEFKKFCFGKGNFVFAGKSEDLTNIWKLELMRDSGELIYQPERIGRIEKDLWLFGNMAIQGGKIFRPDSDGIIWIDGKGYKPQSLRLGPSGEAIEDAIPSLSEKPVDIENIALRLKQTVGGYEAYMGIGWVVASVFSEDIFAQYKAMPILFPHGKRESGKSTLMRWIMSFFGVETEGTGIAETSQNFIARSLSYYSSLGAWFDEYRNEAKVIQKDGFFRSAYNRQLSGKGTATAFQAKGFAVNATLAISGEELPRDNGLFTRCVPLQLSSYKRDREWFDWLNRHASDFSNFVLSLVLNYAQLRNQIMAKIAELKQKLLLADVSDRTAENWAICAGAFSATVFEDEEFLAWVEQSCREIKQTGENEHMLNVFWDDVNILQSEGEIGPKQLKVIGDSLFIWFSSVYETWAVHYRKKTGREPFDKMSILKYLKEEPYFVKQVTQKMAKADRKVYEIKIALATDTIKELAEAVRVAQQIANNSEDD